MVESTITSRGQTTLPKSVREALGVRPGDRVRYVVSGDEVRIFAVHPLSAGCSERPNTTRPPVRLEAIDRRPAISRLSSMRSSAR